MSLALLAEVLAKRGITHRQSQSNRNFAKIYELIDGRSVPVLLINLVDGSFLELPHYVSLSGKSKSTLAYAKEEYDRRFKRWYKKSH